MASFVPSFVKKVMSSVRGGGGMAENFPYELDELLLSPAGTGGLWSVHFGHHVDARKDDPLKGSVTIFVADISRRPNVVCALKNSVRRLKTLRHPHILKFLASAETETEIMIATERVLPISRKLEDLRKDPDALLWVVNLLLKALKFLHEEAGTVHANVRMPSIFLTASGEMKLGGFELASSLKDEESLVCDYGGIFRDVSFKDWPSEVTSPSGSLPWRQLRTFPAYTIDCYMVARLLLEIFQDTGKMPSELANFVQTAAQSDYRKRPNPATLLEKGSLFNNVRIIDIAGKMDSLSVMSPEQRERFLSSVLQGITHLPNDFVAYKVIPSLITMFQIPSAQDSLIGIKLLLTCATRLDSEELQTTIVPILSSLLSKPDRAVRLALLESMPPLIEKLDPRIIQEKIYSHVASGFTDALPALREQTLKSSLLMAPKLSSRQLNGELLRFYARLQGDEQPGIRVNTTVCLGRVAKLLDENTRTKVLGSAYIKALRDPFVPARSAGLAAILATLDLLAIDEIARSVLPNIIPLIIDSDKNVRNAAVKAANQLIKKLEVHAATMPEILAEPVVPETQSVTPTLSETSRGSSWGISVLADKLIGTDLSDDQSNKTKSSGAFQEQRKSSVKNSNPVAPVRSIHRNPVPSPPVITNVSDGWDADNDLLQDIDTVESQDSQPMATFCNSPLFEDDDNPWNQENSTRSSPNPVVLQSSVARTSVSTASKKELKPMVLGKMKPKLSDHF